MNRGRHIFITSLLIASQLTSCFPAGGIEGGSSSSGGDLDSLCAASLFYGEDPVEIPIQEIPSDVLYAGALIPLTGGVDQFRQFLQEQVQYDGQYGTGRYNYNNPIVYNEWIGTSNVESVQAAKMRFLLGQDTPQPWSNIGGTVDNGQYLSIIQQIENGAFVDGRFQVTNIAPEVFQIKGTNILRTVFTFDTPEGPFILKIQHIGMAMQELEALNQLKAIGGEFAVAEMNVFTSEASKGRMAFTLARLVTNAEGQAASTLEAFRLANGLTDMQKSQLQSLYTAWNRHVVDQFGTGQYSKSNIVADIKGDNLVVGSNGQLHIVDVSITNIRGRVTVKPDNTVRLAGSIRGLQEDFAGWLKANGVDVPEITISSEAATHIELPQNAITTIQVVDDVTGALIQEVQVTNQRPSSIVLPRVIGASTWEKFTTALNVVGAVGGGIIIGNEIANGPLSSDDYADLDAWPANDPTAAMESANQQGYEPRLFATFAIPLDTLKNQIARHDQLRDIRAGLGLPEGNEELQLRFRDVLPFTYSLGLSVYICQNVSGDLRVLYTNPVTHQQEMVDIPGIGNEKWILRNKDNFEAIQNLLEDNIAAGLDPLVTLENYQIQGYIDFYTTDSNGNLIYGGAVEHGEGYIAVRYVTYLDGNGEQQLFRPK